MRNFKKRGRPSDMQDEERLNGKLHILWPLGPNKTTIKACSVCSDSSAGGARKRTKYMCKTCSVQPGLCIGQCFERYHTVKRLKG